MKKKKTQTKESPKVKEKTTHLRFKLTLENKKEGADMKEEL